MNLELLVHVMYETEGLDIMLDEEEEFGWTDTMGDVEPMEPSPGSMRSLSHSKYVH